jgi:hypothetical protein
LPSTHLPEEDQPRKTGGIPQEIVTHFPLHRLGLPQSLFSIHALKLAGLDPQAESERVAWQDRVHVDLRSCFRRQGEKHQAQT